MAAEMPHASATLQFEDNTLLARLVGDHDKHLRCLEEGLEVEVARRGNRISIQGVPEQTARTRAVLGVLYQKLAAGENVDISSIEAAIRMS
ncbi:phosphate starvation-inducible protein PhoH, partial [Acetobacter sp. DmW_125123]